MLVSPPDETWPGPNSFGHHQEPHYLHILGLANLIQIGKESLQSSSLGVAIPTLQLVWHLSNWEETVNSGGCSNLCLKKRRPSIVSHLLGMADLDSLNHANWPKRRSLLMQYFHGDNGRMLHCIASRQRPSPTGLIVRSQQLGRRLTNERNTASERKLDSWQATWTPGRPAHVFLHPRWANFGARQGTKLRPNWSRTSIPAGCEHFFLADTEQRTSG
jgi:hypothetical protein